MRGTQTKVWGDDVFEVMHTTTADWDCDDNDDSPYTPQLLSFFLSFFLSFTFSVTLLLLLRRNKLNIVSDDFNQ
jgi:hypothetical protein